MNKTNQPTGFSMKENRQKELHTNEKGLHSDEKGLSTVEYIILLVLIAAAAVALWGTFGEVVTSNLGTATDTISDTLGG